jgi:Cbb3-type cytochrome oxidase component FixQ
MDWASLFYLGVTFGLFLLFAAIAIRTYSRKRKKDLEEPKHRMLDDD